MLRETLLEGLRRFPGDPELIQRLGRELETSGEWQLMQEVLQRQLAHVPAGSPLEAQVDYLLAKASIELGEERRALAMIGRSLLLRPNFAFSHHIKGRALAKLRLFSEAITAQRRCVELAPEFSWGWFELGCLLRRQGDMEGAIAHLRRCLTLQAVSDQQHHVLVLSTLQDAERELALKERKEAALSLWPERPPPHEGERLAIFDEMELQIEQFRLFLDSRSSVR